MVTEMITLKLDGLFLKEIDGIVEASGYQNRTEFIRNALREKIEQTKLNDAMMQIAHLKGASKKKTTDEEFEKIRARAFEEIGKKFR
jgi:metal-responsive CopG/Arc/MetJ family transcriptional regulator